MLQKIKIHRHTARQIQQTITRKLNIGKAYSDTVGRRLAGNSGFLSDLLKKETGKTHKNTSLFI